MSLYNSHTVILIILLSNCFNGYYREVGLAWNWIYLQAVTMVLLRFVMTRPVHHPILQKKKFTHHHHLIPMIPGYSVLYLYPGLRTLCQGYQLPACLLIYIILCYYPGVWENDDYRLLKSPTTIVQMSTKLLVDFYYCPFG